MWKEQFDKQFLVEGNKYKCDLCGHDHTETGDNEGYGQEVKDFISTQFEKLIKDSAIMTRTQLRDKWL